MRVHPLILRNDFWQAFHDHVEKAVVWEMVPETESGVPGTVAADCIRPAKQNP
jgi:hypothetical protein